jgi:hypothetical protein
LVSPGEKMTVQLLVSGYGTLYAAKLSSYPSIDVVEASESQVFHSIHEVGNKLFFGAVQMPLNADGFMLDLCSGGMKPDNWDRPSQFFDVPEKGRSTSRRESPIIFSEMVHTNKDGNSNSIATMTLQIRRTARPGPHTIAANLTYHNGEGWHSSKIEIQFTVRGFYQRHEGLLWTVGTIIALASILL